MKDFKSWLNESGVDNPIDYTQKGSLEMTMGNVKTPMDPNSENWIAETPRLEEYIAFAKQVKDAVDSEDDTLLRTLIADAKDMALFKNEQTTLWKRSQIDGLEKFRSDAEFRRWIGGYIINKIKAFKSWCENSHSKEANKI